MPLERISQGFRDISMSFQNNPLNSDLISLRNENAIVRAVKNIVYTLPGEKPFLPNKEANPNFNAKSIHCSAKSVKLHATSIHFKATSANFYA